MQFAATASDAELENLVAAGKPKAAPQNGNGHTPPVMDEETKKRYQEAVYKPGNLYFLPEAFVVDGKIKTERRSRGIYEARLYHADNNISGHFEIPANYGITEDLADYVFDAPYISMGIKDIRGIGGGE